MSSEPGEFTNEELLALLQQAFQAPDQKQEPNTITTPQARDLMKCSDQVARRRLDQLVREGYLEKAYIWRWDGWGTRTRLRGYRYIADRASGEEVC